MNNVQMNSVIGSVTGVLRTSNDHEAVFVFDMQLPTVKNTDGELSFHTDFYAEELAFDTNWMWFMYAFEKLRAYHHPEKEVRMVYGNTGCSVKVGTLLCSSLEGNLEGLFHCLVSHYQNI